MMQERHTPILLSSSVSLAQGDVQGPDLGKLQNETRTAMLIDEIRMLVRSPSAVTPPVNLGGSIRARFVLGRYELTNDFFPLWLFGPQMENSSDSTGSETSSGPDPADDTKTERYNHFRWTLPRPLLVKPGDVLVPSFSRSRDGIAGAAAVDITYAGRVISEDGADALPNEVPVPFATAWVGAEGTANQISNDHTLFNKFQNTLHVQRFTGRVQSRNAGVDVAESADYFTDSGVKLWLKASRGQADVTTDFLPWASIFDFNRKALTVGRDLPPNHWFVAKVTGIGADETPMIGMVGWRMEKVA